MWGQEVLAAATRVLANAAMDSLVPRLRTVVDDQFVALFNGDDAPMEIEDAAEAGAPRWDVLEECRLDLQRPPSGPYQRISSRRISRTDSDATPMRMRDGRTVLGYQGHYLVDGGKARVILHPLSHPAMSEKARSCLINCAGRSFDASCVQGGSSRMPDADRSERPCHRRVGHPSVYPPS